MIFFMIIALTLRKNYKTRSYKLNAKSLSYADLSTMDKMAIIDQFIEIDTPWELVHPYDFIVVY